jgi:hypothetical protein
MANDDGFPATCTLTKGLCFEESEAISDLGLDLSKEGGVDKHLVRVKYRRGKISYLYAAKPTFAQRLSNIIRSVNRAHALGKCWSGESLGKLISGARKDGELTKLDDDLGPRAVDTAKASPKKRAQKRAAECPSTPNSGRAEAEYLHVANVFRCPAVMMGSKNCLNFDGDDSSAKVLEVKRSKPEDASARDQTPPLYARKDPAPRSSPRVPETLAQLSAASTLSATSQPEAKARVYGFADAPSRATSPGISQPSNSQAAAEPGPSPLADATPVPARPIQSRGNCPVCCRKVTTADMRVNRNGKYLHADCRDKNDVIVID